MTSTTDRSSDYLTQELIDEGWTVEHVRDPESQFASECQGDLVLSHEGEEFKRYDLCNAADLRARCQRLATEAAG